MRPFVAQINRDLDIAWQNRQDVVLMLGFFIIIIALFPLAIGPKSAMLQSLGIPMIWIAAFSSLNGFDRLFAQDVRDGWLDQISLSALGLGWYAVASRVALAYSQLTPIADRTRSSIDVEHCHHQIARINDSAAGRHHGPDPARHYWRGACRGARRGSALIAILVLPLSASLNFWCAGRLHR